MDLVQRCENIKKIYYISTNYTPGFMQPQVEAFLDERCGQAARTAPLVSLVKGYHRINQGKPTGSMSEQTDQPFFDFSKKFDPTLGEVNKKIHMLGKSGPLDIILFDIQHSYQPPKVEFPEVYFGLLMADYDVRLLKLDNPEWEMLRKRINGLPLYYTEEYYRRVREAREALKTETRQEMVASRKEDIQRSLARIKAMVKENIEMTPAWIKDLEMQHNWEN